MSIPLDGNAIAGTLGELFAADVSVATVECAGCGALGAVAEVVIYLDGPGVVARCRGCEQVLFRLVRTADRSWLDMRGVACLTLYA